MQRKMGKLNCREKQFKIIGCPIHKSANTTALTGEDFHTHFQSNTQQDTHFSKSKSLELSDKSHTGSYFQTALAGHRKSRRQCQCSCHRPLPSASNTPKERSGLQGTTCSSGQERWTQPATATGVRPSAGQAIAFASFRILRPRKGNACCYITFVQDTTDM